MATELMAELDTRALAPQKQELLLALYRTAWEEMTWRRNAGYRTVILGLGYCGVILTVVACTHLMPGPTRVCLAGVIALATLFGSGYLASNYQKYMDAARRMVLIEEHVGAFDADFLGRFGALMPAARRTFPTVPLGRNLICIWSIIALAAGGLATAAGILLMS